MHLRILTYNIHKGFAFFTRQYMLEHLRELLRSSKADVVFLQEVMGIHPERVKLKELGSQFEFLADEVWPHFAYGKNAIYTDGHHGNAILSRFPIVNYENTDISNHALEQRGLLHATIEFPNTGFEPLDLLCVHLDLLARGRQTQLKKIVEYTRLKIPDSKPLVLAGDFNDWKKQASSPLTVNLGLKEAGVIRHGHYQASFPSWFPFLSLDRVYVRGFKVVSHQIVKAGAWRKLSDHSPVLVELEIG